MLKVTKNTTMSGQSFINDTLVASMSATIGTDGDGNINKYINNKALYAANKADVRADMTEFETQVYAVQDEILDEESTAESTTTE